jgi:hypothetical protein
LVWPVDIQPFQQIRLYILLQTQFAQVPFRKNGHQFHQAKKTPDPSVVHQKTQGKLHILHSDNPFGLMFQVVLIYDAHDLQILVAFTFRRIAQPTPMNR